jgi:hypothetical protein
MFDTWIKFIEAHERLLLVAVAGLVLWFGIGRIDTLIQNHDNANLQQAKIVAVTQADKTQALAAQSAQQAAQYQALAAKLDAQNAALVVANTELATALAKQQKTDSTLPPSDLVARWNTMVPQADATVTPSGVDLPETGAIATVQQLELVPVQQQKLVNAQTELTNAQSLLTAEGQQIATLNTEVGSLRLQQVDDAKVCAVQISTVKAEARKSKRHWFYAGVVVGFIGRQLIKSETGM